MHISSRKGLSNDKRAEGVLRGMNRHHVLKLSIYSSEATTPPEEQQRTMSRARARTRGNDEACEGTQSPPPPLPTSLIDHSALLDNICKDFPLLITHAHPPIRTSERLQGRQMNSRIATPPSHWSFTTSIPPSTPYHLLCRFSLSLCFHLWLLIFALLKYP